MEHEQKYETVELEMHLEELRQLTELRWMLIQKYKLKNEKGEIDNERLLELLHEHTADSPLINYQSIEAFTHNYEAKIEALRLRNKQRGEDFEFFRRITDEERKNDERLPSEGLYQVPLRYHSDNPIVADDTVSASGYRPHWIVNKILRDRYPKYALTVKDYHRPLGTTNATFDDFNKPQKESEIPTDERKEDILHLVKHYLNVKPYQTVKAQSVPHVGMPLNTGTGYYNRHSYHTTVMAKLTSDPEYAYKPTLKGHYFNATYPLHRFAIHMIKRHGLPFDTKDMTPEQIEKALKRFIAKHATMLFTRVHISLLKIIKCRPVYNVDDLFLKIEAMLTYPAMIQARPIDSCIMYSLETIRGGCHYLDAVAKMYLSYFTIDWSSFDQTLPRVVTDIYYTDFLESLIVVNHRTVFTIESKENASDRTQSRFNKYTTLLHFLHTWYNSMVYVTADGYGFQRTSAGVPSGLLNTQYLDSFGNLFILMDGLLEYGFTIEEIKTMRFFIMGDDNSGFTQLPLIKLESFIKWFSAYALNRWNMKLSESKSIITALRQNIEILGYKCNFGDPKRNIDKLLAQLVYPEHGTKENYMSYRAIGIAYAAAGQCEIFHRFCEDIYLAFMHAMEPMTPDLKKKLAKYIPGIFKSVDNYFELVDYTKFPTIHEVRQVYSEWLGSLDYTPKWDRSYFLGEPYCTEDEIVTIADYRKEFNIPRQEAKTLFIDETIF